MLDPKNIPVSTVETGQETTIIRFARGHLALTEENVSRLETLLGALTDQGNQRKLVLDFANVDFVSSAALDTLVRIHRRLRASGGCLALRDLNDNVYEVFEVTRLVNLFDVGRQN
jgi:anti-sigma B factor antagonist